MKIRNKARQARLVLEDGSEFAGFCFGRARPEAGEVVFSTGMGGYAQTLTDPAYRGQILVSAYPLMGNIGVPVKPKTCEPFFDEQGIPLHFESPAPQISGLVVSEACDEPSHYSSGAALSDWLEKNNVPGIYGVDTRALVRRLRENGSMQGKILVDGKSGLTMDSGLIENPAAEVSRAEPKTYLPINAAGTRGDPAEAQAAHAAPVKIALIDCGVKANLLRCLLGRGAEVTCLPWNHDLKGIEYDGLILAGGPGDPKACGKTIATVRRAFDGGGQGGREKPVFGVGLGCLIMALAAGGDTYRLPFGHRSQNQPSIEAGTNRCYVTSQNHGWAVRAESLPRGWDPWFVNANDNSVEGIRSARGPFAGVQFNPEGCPGSRDTEFLIDRFLEQARKG